MVTLGPQDGLGPLAGLVSLVLKEELVPRDRQDGAVQKDALEPLARGVCTDTS